MDAGAPQAVLTVELGYDGQQERGKVALPCEVEGLKDLEQGEVLAVPEDDHLPRLLAQLAFDEAQQVLLVHARAVVHMRVHLRKEIPCC